jgi:hypothetical protein
VQQALSSFEQYNCSTVLTYVAACSRNVGAQLRERLFKFIQAFILYQQAQHWLVFRVENICSGTERRLNRAPALLRLNAPAE